MEININALKYAQEVAKTFFSLNLPTTEESLQEAYRKAALKLHPDRQQINAEANKQAFQEMQAAHEFILALRESPAIFQKNWATDKGLCTVDGTSLSGLGKGLGGFSNGISCSECKGRGYASHSSYLFRRCSRCFGRGQILLPCKACSGTGKFRINATKIVECKKCLGTGQWFRGPLTFCYQCLGMGGKETGTIITNYVKCSSCKGTGEKEIFNPVLRKGVLF